MAAPLWILLDVYFETGEIHRSYTEGFSANAFVEYWLEGRELRCLNDLAHFGKATEHRTLSKMRQDHYQEVHLCSNRMVLSVY